MILNARPRVSLCEAEVEVRNQSCKKLALWVLWNLWTSLAGSHGSFARCVWKIHIVKRWKNDNHTTTYEKWPIRQKGNRSLFHHICTSWPRRLCRAHRFEFEGSSCVAQSGDRCSLEFPSNDPALAICVSPLQSSWATLFFACHHLQVGILTDHVGQHGQHKNIVSSWFDVEKPAYLTVGMSGHIIFNGNRWSSPLTWIEHASFNAADTSCSTA